MKINNIDIENFRNISQLHLNFEAVNIIHGENAQGKTNLIEAIYLFTGSKSFRGVKDKELIRFGCEYAKLKIDFESEKREQNASLLIKGRRQAHLNGVKKNSACALGDEIKAVIFSPIHLSMIKDGPIGRRKFIDTALFQIKSGYRNVVKEYNRCLIQRNMLLKDNNKQTNLSDMLYVWDRNLAKSGAKMIYQRQKYINSLLPIAQEIYSGLSSGKEEISLIYDSISKDDYSELKQIEEQLLLTLENNRTNDIKNTLTSAGPHRDDLKIEINTLDARTYGSQGQQRSCVLALKLAEAELLKQMTGKEPVALLDDVMSELDENRQDYVLNHMKSRQSFITCCDANTVLRLKKGKTFHIENGGLV